MDEIGNRTVWALSTQEEREEKIQGRRALLILLVILLAIVVAGVVTLRLIFEFYSKEAKRFFLCGVAFCRATSSELKHQRNRRR
jgi:hypothetical protein